ncbi:hypothetical protein DRO59_03370 [Candidatus Bathyarchaeota archaeon]|nr:MAG: hypothetical protein DRO59_03370 [Candidatus Bathyarchaeota archaeon]
MCFSAACAYGNEVDWVLKHSRLTRSQAWLVVQCAYLEDWPELVLAICKVESHFNPYAVSTSGAVGLGQIMPVWVPELKEAGIIKSQKDLFDIEVNIRAVGYILQKLFTVESDLVHVLYRYYGARSRDYAWRVLLAIGEVMCAK